MKFFFPELGCFGGTVITPAVQTISDDVSTTHRRVTRGNSKKHWRPELTAIEEDCGVLNVRRPGSESPTVGRSVKKSVNKARSTGKARSHSYGGDYRISAPAMTFPAFSPTPFVF